MTLVLRSDVFLNQAKHCVGAAKCFKTFQTKARAFVLVIERCDAEFFSQVRQGVQGGTGIAGPSRNFFFSGIKAELMQDGGSKLPVIVVGRTRDRVGVERDTIAI